MSFVALLFLIASPWIFSDHQSNDDLREIWEDNTKNSLGDEYHKEGWWFRAGVLGGAGVLVTLLNFWDTKVLAWQEFIGYCVYAAAVFAYDFSPRLNRWRMLFFPDYGITKWYVSRSATASKWDKAFVEYAPQYGVTPEVLLKRFAITVLCIGSVFFAGCILWAKL